MTNLLINAFFPNDLSENVMGCGTWQLVSPGSSGYTVIRWHPGLLAFRRQATRIPLSLSWVRVQLLTAGPVIDHVSPASGSWGNLGTWAVAHLEQGARTGHNGERVGDRLLLSVQETLANCVTSPPAWTQQRTTDTFPRAEQSRRLQCWDCAVLHGLGNSYTLSTNMARLL